jgi:hypothetical protein
MQLLINEDIFGWKLTGLLGKDAKWFLGYSLVSDLAVQYQASRYSKDKYSSADSDIITTKQDSSKTL